MDTSDAIVGKREQAPVEGAAGSDIPPQPLGKRCRAGDVRLAFVAAKEAVKAHARWRHFEMRD